MVIVSLFGPLTCVDPPICQSHVINLGSTNNRQTARLILPCLAPTQKRSVALGVKKSGSEWKPCSAWGMRRGFCSCPAQSPTPKRSPLPLIQQSTQYGRGLSHVSLCSARCEGGDQRNPATRVLLEGCRRGLNQLATVEMYANDAVPSFPARIGSSAKCTPASSWTSPAVVCLWHVLLQGERLSEKGNLCSM